MHPVGSGLDQSATHDTLSVLSGPRSGRFVLFGIDHLDRGSGWLLRHADSQLCYHSLRTSRMIAKYPSIQLMLELYDHSLEFFASEHCFEHSLQAANGMLSGQINVLRVLDLSNT